MIRVCGLGIATVSCIRSKKVVFQNTSFRVHRRRCVLRNYSNEYDSKINNYSLDHYAIKYSISCVGKISVYYKFCTQRFSNKCFVKITSKETSK